MPERYKILDCSCVRFIQTVTSVLRMEAENKASSLTLWACAPCASTLILFSKLWRDEPNLKEKDVPS